MVDNNRLYKALNVDRNASASEIKKAYRKLALKHHPDRNKDNKEAAEKKFKEIGEAYEVLGNDEKRKMYDQFGEPSLNQNGGGGSPFDIFEQMFGQGGSPFGQGGSPFGQGGSPFGGHPFEEMFGQQQGRQQSRKGASKQIVVLLTFQEIMNGVDRVVEFKRTVIDKTKKVKVCKQCNGRGQITRTVRMGPMIQQTSSVCSACHGMGKIGSTKEETSKFKISIPKGTKRGDKVLLENQGDQDLRADAPGDVVVIFDEKPQSGMTRRKHDLVLQKSISLGDALIGVEFDFKHPSGNIIKVASNGVVDPQKVYCIRRHGFPVKNSVRMGDLVVKFDIIYPREFDANTLQLLKKAFQYKSPPPSNTTRCILEVHADRDSDATFDDHDDDDHSSHPGQHPNGGVECAQQ